MSAAKTISLERILFELALDELRGSVDRDGHGVPALADLRFETTLRDTYVSWFPGGGGKRAACFRVQSGEVLKRVKRTPVKLTVQDAVKRWQLTWPAGRPNY